MRIPRLSASLPDSTAWFYSLFGGSPARGYVAKGRTPCPSYSHPGLGIRCVSLC